jgi:hypothetical protein
MWEKTMSTQFEHIIESYVTGSATLEATCQRLVHESQADPARTRFWSQRIEKQLRDGRISAVAARAMLDALEGFQCDKTMWIDPAYAVPPAASPHKARPPIIETPEQLRAALFAPLAPGKSEPSKVPPADVPSSKSSAAEQIPNTSFAVVPLGTVLKNRYRLIAHLGMGGIGQVFDAIDLDQPGEAHVTIKIIAVNLKHEPYALGALTTAVRQAQRLDHPNIVRVDDIEHDGERVFITMEPLKGRWLSSMVREVRNKGMSYETAWPIVEGIANGLAYAHARGVVHSDLSPHAVFVTEEGIAKIMGFGLAHAVPASNEALDVLDTLTLRAYTEAYTADAWVQQGRPHPADDLYPLGVIAYEMLAGVHPFARCSLAVARQRGMKCAPIEGLNRRARKLIERCLSFEREVRPKDGSSFLKRMRRGMWARLRLASGASA